MPSRNREPGFTSEQHYEQPDFSAPPARLPYAPVAAPYGMQTTAQRHFVIAWVCTVLTGFYMLPWAVAATRNRSDVENIAIVNAVTGWTGIGWIISLIWALRSERPQQPLYFRPTYR